MNELCENFTGVPPVGTQRSSLHAVDGTAGDTELSLGLHLGASGVVRGVKVRGVVHLGTVRALGTGVLGELTLQRSAMMLHPELSKERSFTISEI